MSRTSIAIFFALLCSGTVVLEGRDARGPNPHLDRTRLPRLCEGCHVGHGSSESKMLRSTQKDACYSCHGFQTDVDKAIRDGLLASGTPPPLLGPGEALTYRHPMGEGLVPNPAEPTCTSCHSPHRGMPANRPTNPPEGRPYPSPRDAEETEFALCEGCHGSAGGETLDPRDISRLFNIRNRSFHPVHASSAERSFSVLPRLRSREINCTDCHGNSDPSNVPGPHFSPVRFLLKASYERDDGTTDLSHNAQLCASCHDLDKVISAEDPFPLHQLHSEAAISCSTCHNPHGSIANRSLIRFGEGVAPAGVGPSTRTGRLVYESDVSGSGSCEVSCHGVDHAPATYGIAKRFGDPGVKRKAPVTSRRGGTRRPL